MGDVKAGEPFGIDATVLAKIDWDLALKRISHDLRSDFIYAPHLGFIYRMAGKELIAQVNGDFKGGQYSPGVPVTIEVPKSFSNPRRSVQTAWPSFIHAQEASYFHGDQRCLS